MRKYSTTLLRICIAIIGISVVSLITGLTWFIISIWNSNSDQKNLATLLFLGIYLIAIPFFIGTYHTMKILGYIDNKQAFSLFFVKSLRYIKYCSTAIFIICITIFLPFFYFWADLTDAPGLMVIGIIISGTPFIFTVFVSILQRLFIDAVTVKEELELVV